MQADVRPLVHQAIICTTPGAPLPTYILLGVASVFARSMTTVRYMRFLKRSPVEIGIGTGIGVALVMQDSPMMKTTAKIVLGSLAILKCRNDLEKVYSLGRVAWRLLRGKEYVAVEDNPWDKKIAPAVQASTWMKLTFQAKVRKAQLKEFFLKLVEIILRLGKLILHLADAYAAYSENVVFELFFHGSLLWKELNSDDSKLSEYLRKTETVNSWLFPKLGLDPVTTKFIEGLKTSQKIVNAVPSKEKMSKVVAEKKVAVGKAVISLYDSWVCRVKNICQKTGILYVLPQSLTPTPRACSVYGKEDYENHQFLDPASLPKIPFKIQ